MLLGEKTSQRFPCEVSLTLMPVTNSQHACDAKNSSFQRSERSVPQQPSVARLSKQSSGSSRASFEASIDALVDVQLAKLAEAAREPHPGELEKVALVRTASAPEADSSKPIAAQTSGLDWSGSIEAEPTLISRWRKDDDSEARVQSADFPKKLRYQPATKTTLARVSEDMARSSALTDALDAIQPGSASLTNSGDLQRSEPTASSIPTQHEATSPAPSKESLATSSTIPALVAPTFESPFEAAQFQEEPIARPADVPEVAAEEILTSASVPPVQVATSMLAPEHSEAEAMEPGSTSQGVGRILRDVAELMKVANERGPPHTLAEQEQSPAGRLHSPDLQSQHKRQAGMKSLSVLETEGIPMLLNSVAKPELGKQNLTANLQVINEATPMRMDLAQGGGFKCHNQQLHASDVRSTGLGVSLRSQTVPSMELRKALDEIERTSQFATPSLATLQSGTPAIHLGMWGDDEDMAASTTLQEDITSFQPVEDTITKSPTRAPSLFDLTSPHQQQEGAEWLIPWDEIELGRRIGAGSFGEVFRAQWRHTDVAVKRITHVNESLVGEFEAEVNLMSKLKHPNVVQFLGACIEYPNLSIVTQFMPRGSLFNLLHRAKVRLDDRQKLWMALDVAKGMLYLHSCRPPIVHGDVSSKNMLVDRDFSIRVADFGMSRQRRKAMLSAKSQGGTAEWTAPEVLRGLPYHEKADVFSFGVILHELMTQTVPWSELSSIQVVGAVGWGNAKLQIPSDILEPIRSLMAACMESDPQKRPDFEEIIVSLRTIRREVQLPTPAVTQEPMASRRVRPDLKRLHRIIALMLLAKITGRCSALNDPDAAPVLSLDEHSECSSTKPLLLTETHWHRSVSALSRLM